MSIVPIPTYNGRLPSTASASTPAAEEYRLAIDTIPGLVWSALPDGYIDFLNRRWQEYTGLSFEQAQGWGWQAAIHPEDLGPLVTYWRGLLTAGEAGETEARLRRHDGLYRWFLFRALPYRDDNGTLIKWYGQTTDIHDRKGAEATLEGEKRLLEMIARGDTLDAILDTLCSLVEAMADLHCSVLLVDTQTQRFRHAAAPSIPASFTSRLDGNHPGNGFGPCGAAAVSGEAVIVEDFVSDTRFPGCAALAAEHGLRSCWSAPIRALDGGVLGTFAMYSPVPALPTPEQQSLIERFTHIASIAIRRSQAEDALRRSEASLARAQRLSSTGSFSWHADSREMTWSEETYRICEVDPGTRITPELARDLIHPEDVQMFRDMIASDRVDFSFECRLITPGGTVRHLQVDATAVRDDAGRMREWVGAIRDITEWKRSNDALHQVRAQLTHVARVATLGELTASIAHELNQPLAGIVMNGNACLRWLAADPPNLEQARETARRTIRDGARAGDVLVRLRALFRKTETAAATFDLAEAVREVAALTGSELQKHRIAFRVDLERELPPICGDRVQVQQVLLNLMVNGMEALNGVSDRKREIKLAARRRDDTLTQIDLVDNGMGFDGDAVDRIFDAFYTTKAGGMGMGLSISRSIVERHGGRLWAAANDGPGATVSFTLPAAP